MVKKTSAYILDRKSRRRNFVDWDRREELSPREVIAVQKYAMNIGDALPLQSANGKDLMSLFIPGDTWADSRHKADLLVRAMRFINMEWARASGKIYNTIIHWDVPTKSIKISFLEDPRGYIGIYPPGFKFVPIEEKWGKGMVIPTDNPYQPSSPLSQAYDYERSMHAKHQEAKRIQTENELREMERLRLLQWETEKAGLSNSSVDYFEELQRRANYERLEEKAQRAADAALHRKQMLEFAKMMAEQAIPVSRGMHMQVLSGPPQRSYPFCQKGPESHDPNTGECY